MRSYRIYAVWQDKEIVERELMGLKWSQGQVHEVYKQDFLMFGYEYKL